jgi:hypothetical protein
MRAGSGLKARKANACDGRAGEGCHAALTNIWLLCGVMDGLGACLKPLRPADYLRRLLGREGRQWVEGQEGQCLRRQNRRGLARRVGLDLTPLIDDWGGVFPLARPRWQPAGGRYLRRCFGREGR